MTVGDADGRFRIFLLTTDGFEMRIALSIQSESPFQTLLKCASGVQKSAEKLTQIYEKKRFDANFDAVFLNPTIFFDDFLLF